MSESAKYILALLDVPGVGRVAASRLVEHFPSAEELLACPHEQLVLRLKGVARAAEIADDIRRTIRERTSAADPVIEDLESHEIQLLTPLDEDWPDELNDLARPDRPVILFVHGNNAALSGKKAGLFARPPLTDHGFDRAQTALRRILRTHAAPLTGGSTGFDEIVHRVCSSPDHAAPSILILPCGLGRIKESLRSVAAATVKSGGLLITSFDLNHGPFEHDDFERAMIQAALSNVAVFIEPAEDTPEHRALDWIVKAGRAVFVIGGTDTPAEAHTIVDEIDFDWLELALALREDTER